MIRQWLYDDLANFGICQSFTVHLTVLGKQDRIKKGKEGPLVGVGYRFLAVLQACSKQMFGLCATGEWV